MVLLTCSIGSKVNKKVIQKEKESSHSREHPNKSEKPKRHSDLHSKKIEEMKKKCLNIKKRKE